MSEELLTPEIIGEMALCYYFSRDFVQEKVKHHHRKSQQKTKYSRHK